MIPPGSLVYLSTDDPEGKCTNCWVNKKPCTSYAAGSKPKGCPEDTSWGAFIKFGWKIRFLDDYIKSNEAVAAMNPNLYGMIESIVCSRSKVFAGTFHSTFTGYIHRLRGYHGLAESSYYHTTNFLMAMKMKKSIGMMTF